MTRIAVIGGGRIGESLIAGLLRAHYQVRDLVVAEHNADRAREVANEYGVRVTDTVDATETADVVVIAVKPNDVEAVVTDINKADLDGQDEKLYVSMAAGIPISFYETRLPAGVPVVRVMPNTPMLVGAGMSAIAPGRYAQAEHLTTVSDMLKSVGQVLQVKEAQMDAVTAVSGSGPAYFFLVAEAMVDAAVAAGLSRDVAEVLVNQTMMGSAKMLTETDATAHEHRAAVTSPAGTTAAGVRALEANNVRIAFYQAVTDAAARSKELGRPEE